MYNGQYLIAANSKRGQLIFNIFRKIDLLIASIGAVATFLLLIIVQPSSLLSGILTLLPLLVCAFLVIPIPNYHNVLCAIQSIINFFTERRNYIWRGWCFYEKFGSEEPKK